MKDKLHSVLGWLGVLAIFVIFWLGFGRGIDGEIREMDTFYSEQ